MKYYIYPLISLLFFTSCSSSYKLQLSHTNYQKLDYIVESNDLYPDASVIGGANHLIETQLKKYKETISSNDSLFNRLHNISNLTVSKNNESNEITTSINTDILFDFDSYELSNTTVIDTLCAVLSDDNIVIDLIGHTDNVGSEEYNKKLSLLRAKAVESYIKEHSTVSINSVIGKGKSNPVDTNMTPLGRAKNRRVEIAIKEVTDGR